MDDETPESESFHQFLGINMGASQKILSIGREHGVRLFVHSSKVDDRRRDFQSILTGGSESAAYSFTGFLADATLELRTSDGLLEPAFSEYADDRYIVKYPMHSGAVFFEQTQYTVYICFSDDTDDARIFSPLAAWCEESDWNSDTKTLILPLNFGNDLGDFEICWEWTTGDGERHTASMRGQVFSYKLDIRTHFRWMLDEVQEKFNWIQLDLLRQTTWGWSRDADAEATRNTWLAVFQEVRDQMSRGFRELIARHRQRLMPETHHLRADRIRKVPPRLEEKIREGLIEHPDRRYRIERLKLDADTPENRYIKHLLVTTLRDLHGIREWLEPMSRIARVFKDRLGEWADEWEHLRRHRFWQGVGEFRGLQRESQILSQDPLYVGLRRSRYWLEQGLTLLEDELRGGIQNVAQLYEIWCFIRLDVLICSSGWYRVYDSGMSPLSDDDNRDNDEIRAGSARFTYRKADGPMDVDLELLFQPTAGITPSQDAGWKGMLALPVTQQPDIVLRLKRGDLPHAPTYSWIFDAKYRLEGNNAPKEAVNQMHRYRDAILWSAETAGEEHARLIREGIGAFVLYPGTEKTGDEFTQIKSVGRTNIGAFPLRPMENKEAESEHLQKHLAELLKIEKAVSAAMVHEEQVVYGTVPDVRSPEQPLTVSGTVVRGIVRSYMDEKYWATCRFHRIPVGAVEGMDPDTWGYLLLENNRGKSFGCFPIRSCTVMKRNLIAEKYKEAGIPIRDEPGREDAEYWLFELRDQVEMQLPKIPRSKGAVVKVLDAPVV